MSSSTEKYLQEFEKYKNVEILEGIIYRIHYRNIRYTVLKVDKINNFVILQRTDIKTLNEIRKTLHWARKNLLHLNI